MKRVIQALALAAIALCMNGAAKADDVIRFATEGAYPPFNERAADGSLVGFEIDLGMAMCAKINRKCEFVAQDWDGMIPGLLVKKYDGIFASMAITDERKKQIDFTDKYYQTGGAFVAAEGAKVDLTGSDLGGKTIGTIPGTAQCYLEKKYPNATVKVYPKADALYLDLTSGRLDAIFLDSNGVDFGFLKTDAGKGYGFVSDVILDQECFGVGVGIGVRKEDTELKEQLNKAIAAVRADGTYQAIEKKYFSHDIYGE
jgi:lysine-arginine-ornithine-binding protein